MLGAFSGGASGSGTATMSPGGGGTPPPVAIADEVVADGVAVPVRTAELAVEAGGIVTDVAVALGDSVDAGDVLVALDTAAIDAEIAGARAAVDAASGAVRTGSGRRRSRPTSRLPSPRPTWTEPRRRWRRPGTTTPARTRRRRPGTPPGRRSASRKAAATGAAEGVAAAEADVRRAEAAVASLELARDDLSVRAPFAGRWPRSRSARERSSRPGQVLVRLADESAWEFIATELDESGIAGVRVGAPATVTLDGVPGTSIPGTVARIGAYGESRQGGIVYEVVVVPTGDVPDGVRWNMTTTVAIKVGEMRLRAVVAAPARSPSRG